MSQAGGAWDTSTFIDDDDTNPFAEKSPAVSPQAISLTTPLVPDVSKPQAPFTEGPSKATFGGAPRREAANVFADEVASASELRAKEAELRRREEALNVREQEAELVEQRNSPNYPPFPTVCCIKPWVYHNIEDEIPQASWQRQKAYFTYWHFHWAVLTGNMVAAAAQMNLIGMRGLEGPLITFIFSIIYWVAFSYIGFHLMYRSLYKGIKDGSSFRLVLYLGTQMLHSFYAMYMAVGAMNTGGAGFIGAVDLLHNDHTVSAVIVFTSAICWTIDSLAGGVFFYLHYLFFKQNGHTLAEAQSQAFSSAANNKTIQNATFTIAETALQNPGTSSA